MASTYPAPPPFHHVFLTKTITNVSTGSSTFVVPGFQGKIKKIWTVLDGAITGADADLSFEIGGTAVTNGGITITQSGSAAGDVDTAVPTAENTFTVDQPIELITDGGSTGSRAVTVTFQLEPI